MPQRFLPQIERESGVITIYHGNRSEGGETATLIVRENDHARQAYLDGALIKRTLIFER